LHEKFEQMNQEYESDANEHGQQTITDISSQDISKLRNVDLANAPSDTDKNVVTESQQQAPQDQKPTLIAKKNVEKTSDQIADPFADLDKE
jgi:hypothetical protein